MASTKKQIIDLLRETARSVFESSEAYLRFLDCAAANYKYCWRDQIAIYAQRPSATACADFKQWNDLGYWIKGGTSGIALIDDSGLGSTGLRYVYDIADTRKLTGPSVLIWEVKDNQKGRVAKEIQKRFALNTASSDFGVLLSSWADRVAENRQESWLAELRSAMQTNTEDENRAKEFVLESVRYMLYRRCNLEPESKAYFDVYFANESRYNQLTEMCILGQASSAAAEEALREIEKAVKYVMLEERSRQHGTELQENGRVLSSGVGSARGTEDREVRVLEEDIPAGTSDGPVHGHDDGRDLERAPGGDRPTGKRDDGSAHGADSEGARHRRSAESQRPDGVDRRNEQHPKRRRGNRSRRSDLQLTEQAAGLEQFSLFSEQAQIDKIERAEESKIPSALSFAQDEIDQVLRFGGNTEHLRECVVANFEKQKSVNEIADVLKTLYIGGNGIVTQVGRVTAWYGDEGICLTRGSSAQYGEATQIIPWQRAAKRIGQLLEAGTFATKAEVAGAETYERREVAEKLWYLVHDLSESGTASGCLQNVSEGFVDGYPEDTAWLAGKLVDPEFRSVCMRDFESFQDAYQQNSDVLRFHYHNLSEIHRRLDELDLPRKKYRSEIEEFSEVSQYITEDEINQAIAYGGGVYGSKGRIFNYFISGPTKEEKEAFLKKEYGIGGRSHALSGAMGSSEEHDGKGLKLEKKGCPTVNLSWSKVAERVTALIESGLYLSAQEQAQFDKIQEEKALAEEEEQASPGAGYDLGYGHLGAGLAVWNRLEEEHGDYKTVAHIAPDRTVTIYDDEMPQTVRDEIQRIADTSQMTISTTQDAPVFSVPPKEQEQPEMFQRTSKQYPPDTEPYIYCEWSESPVFADETRYNVGEFDALMKHADEERVAGAKAALEKYGTWEKWYEADDPENARFLAYDKVKFTVVMPDGTTYTERQDIGDGDGGVLDFLSQYPTYRAILPALREAAAQYQLAEAEQAAQKYVDGTMEGEDGFAYDGAGVYDLQDKRWLRVYGNFPDERAVEQTKHDPATKEPSTGPDQAVENDTVFAAPSRPIRKKVSPSVVFPEIPDAERRDYRITDDDLGVGVPSQRYARNIAAIRLLKELEKDKRLATPEEQTVLAQYVGWGGLADCFDERHSRYDELKAQLTESEYSAARESTLTAFYTPPVVIRAMYQVLENMGFKTGNILEPSCGIGNFLGMLPESMRDSRIYGVELDSISGRIAQQLYQRDSIMVQAFENTELPDSFFDVAIGNVPFGQFKVSDRRYNKYNFYIHDYFFARTLDKVRPGGVIAFITAKGTLDKSSPAVRRYIAQRADLLGAIRLPTNTFKGAAGTEVTSDILFLQKRDRMISTEPDWVHLNRDANGCVMNAYFVEHPQMILGEMKEVSGPYGPETACIAREGEDLEEMLSYAIRSIYGSITETQIGEPEELSADSIPADPTVRNFSFTITDGKVYYRENSLMHPVQVSTAAEKRIKALIALRDCVRTLIEYQTEDYPDADIRAQREQLNDVYDAFAKQFGRINSRENKRVFRDDDAYYLMSSLEVLDEEGNFVRKADMFDQRTIRPAAVVEHVDTASEALTVSLGEKGRVDIAYMAELTGKSEQELEADLRGVIFRDIDCPEGAEKISPESVDLSQYPLVAADEYLSGNVRRKLRMARAMYDAAPEPLKDAVEPNVQALEKVQPEDLTADKISVRLGATWLPVSVVEQFMYELFDTPEYAKKEIHVLYSEHTSQWNITRKSLDYTNVLASSTYGTGRANGYRLLEEALNLRNVRVFDYTETSDGKRVAVVNEEETLAAQSKEDQIKAAFADWIWADPERRREICELYNEKFNSTRPREYDGSFLRFAGINPEIKLRPHQVNAIARILLGGNTLLAHVVGAGKTFEMIAAAMESKRLGLCSKSLVAVPNHLTEQWASEWLQLYPSASLLVATEADFTTQKRKRFCARIATGDYDGIIIGHSQLEKIPLSQERLREGLEKQRKEIFDEILEIKRKDGDRFSVKQLEKKIKDVERKLHELNDQSSKDSVVTFEELGVDRLFVDEAHYFKNLAAFTKMHNVSGINQIEAKKSSDLFLKCRYLDELTDGHGVVFATGTPISNTMVELYTMQRYLQYYTLERYGLLHFDAWASAFGETVTAIELAPEGTGYRSKTRFARFYNLPELMTIFREIADIQTADMLQLPVPKANYQTVQLEPSAFQKELIQEFGQRAERVRSRMVTPGEDNMLKITGDGRKLALDQRLTNPMLPDSETSKTTACAERIYEIWKQGESEKWTQLVFCDFSTPAKKNPIQMEENQDGEIVMAGFQNVYQDLAGKLIAKGIPKNEIAFVHSAKTQADKKKLFAKVRAGQIRVLIGSTDKMGAGTNVQTRLKALHRLTPPWRPSDLEQQDGRIIRQGNENPEVEIYTYVTKGSFDGYMYQTMETKQKFISQIMTSKSAVRTMEDVDASALSYAEIKALCVSDPRIKEKIELDIEVQKLNTLKASYQSQKFALEDRITQYYPREIQSCEARLRNMQKDLAFFNEQPVVDGFSPMTIHGKTYTEKKAAGLALLESVKKMTRPDLVPLGQYRGFAMKLSLNILTGQHVVTLTHMMQYRVELGPDVYGNITRLDNALAGISAEITESEEKLKNLKTQLENAQDEVMKPFAQEDELREKTARVNELNILLNLDASDHQDNKVIDNGGVKGYCQMADDTQKIKEMEYQSFEITQ